MRPASSSSNSAVKTSEELTSGSSFSRISSICSASSGRSTPSTRASEGGSGDSSNNDASDTPSDANPSLCSSSILICVGSSSQMSSQQAVSFAPCFINKLGPQAFLVV